MAAVGEARGGREEARSGAFCARGDPAGRIRGKRSGHNLAQMQLGWQRDSGERGSSGAGGSCVWMKVRGAEE